MDIGVRPLRCDADAMITPFFFALPRKLHEEFVVWEEHPIINRTVLPTLGSAPYAPDFSYGRP